MNNTTRSVLMAVALLLVYFLFGNNKPIHNEGSLDNNSENNAISENVTHAPMMEAAPEIAMHDEPIMSEHLQKETAEDEDRYFEQRDYAPPEDIYLKGKFSRRNKARRSYRNINYRDSKRGDFGKDQWSDFLDKHNNILSDGQRGSNDRFAPVDESKGQLAIFKDSGKEKCGSNQDCNPEDLFDVNKYLPQEVNDDWYEVMPEPVSVKNRHLINVTKPIGINTIGTSLRNSAYDLRGSPACPKFVVSPWLQSSIEPDSNLKSMY